jgi:Tfp pilus assembly protein PilE
MWSPIKDVLPDPGRLEAPQEPGPTSSFPTPRLAREHGVASFELMLAGLVVGLLLVIAMPALLRLPARANNVDAQANLQNAVVQAKAAYAPAQSYSFRGLPLSTLSFASSAPSYSWTTASCAGQSPNCLSEQVVDVGMPGDSQGVLLATWSSTTRTCWFAVDLETVPTVLDRDRGGVAFDTASHLNSAVSNAGIYYGRSSAGATSCSAADATGDSGHGGWSASVSGAGIVG